MDLLKMLETLDEEDRALLLLKYAEGYEYEELAAIFEISVSACKMRISRAREKLQSRFPRILRIARIRTTMKDFLEQLADRKVREPPPDFNRRLHQRVNRTLVVQQVIDFFVGRHCLECGHISRVPRLAGCYSPSPADSPIAIAASVVIQADGYLRSVLESRL